MFFRVYTLVFLFYFPPFLISLRKPRQNYQSHPLIKNQGEDSKSGHQFQTPLIFSNSPNMKSKRSVCWVWCQQFHVQPLLFALHYNSQVLPLCLAFVLRWGSGSNVYQTMKRKITKIFLKYLLFLAR